MSISYVCICSQTGYIATLELGTDCRYRAALLLVHNQTVIHQTLVSKLKPLGLILEVCVRVELTYVDLQSTA
jgi:hypothetical protein